MYTVFVLHHDKRDKRLEIDGGKEEVKGELPP